MGVAFETKGKQNVDVHYVNTPVPCAVEENFEACYHDTDDFALAEVLQAQESVYQSFKASSRDDSRSNPDRVQSRETGNSSAAVSFVSQLAMDEVLAKELQELENQLAVTSLCQINGTESDIASAESSSANGKHNSASTSTQVPRQDDIDPDNMTYEELQSLGEAVGTECRGLSDELISFLPSTTYKTGLFSKKEKHECVICYMAYKNRDKLTTLPCQHQYHKSCVTRWLKINKACPVCNEEVFGS